MPRYSEKAKLIAAAVFGGVVVISGAATAATGSLPLVSHGHSHSHPTPQTPDVNDDQGDDTGTTTDTTDPTDTNQPDGNSSAVTDAAHNKTVTGKNHGQDVCKVASDGKCLTRGQSGDSQGQSTLPHGKAHQNTNTHNQSALPHGKAHVNSNTHSQSALPHGKAGQNGHTSG